MSARRRAHDDPAPVTASRRAAVLRVLRSPECDWTDTRRVAAAALATLEADVMTETLITVLARDARRLIKVTARGDAGVPVDAEVIAVGGTDRLLADTTDTERAAAADRLVRLAGGLTVEAGKLREYLPPVKAPAELPNPVVAADELAAARDARLRHGNRQRARDAQRRARERYEPTAKDRAHRRRLRLLHRGDAAARRRRRDDGGASGESTTVHNAVHSAMRTALRTALHSAMRRAMHRDRDTTQLHTTTH